MTLIACETRPEALPADAVKGTEWQVRLKETGWTQKRFADLLGSPENTVSRQLRGDWGMPGYLLAALVALEGMSDAQREDWLARVRRERETKRKG
ncbi:MAG TPA: hypothetical protein VL358_04455 [Caulobacteraceae bacterium]|nr:hypothetical protein [Caulobacteraceae bacterium]